MNVFGVKLFQSIVLATISYFFKLISLYSFHFELQIWSGDFCAMNKLLKLVQLGLRSQTMYSHIQILLIIISRLVSFGLLQHTNVREAFSCVPKPNATIEQLCYHNYTSSYSRIFVAVLIVDGLFYLTWIIFSVYGAFVLRNLKRNEEGLSYPCSKSITFRGAYISALGFRCKAALSMTVATGLWLSVPSPYNCPLPSDTARMLFNQTQNELFCHDQRYKAKTNLKIDFLTINVFILALCITELVYVTEIRLEKILYKVLGTDAPTSCELRAVRYSVNSLQGKTKLLTLLKNQNQRCAHSKPVFLKGGFGFTHFSLGITVR